jgi:DNA-binding CsgD family transcriptional regulator
MAEEHSDRGQHGRPGGASSEPSPSGSKSRPPLRTAGHGDGAFGGASGGDLFTAAEWSRLCAAMGLSAREAEVVRLILAGAGEQGVAFALGVSRGTVHTYLRRIYRKVDAHDHCELAVRVFAAFLRGREGREG